MTTYVRWAVCSLYLTVAGFCGAASFTPVPVTCGQLESSNITNVNQRLEVSASGFSVLPPSRRKLVRQVLGLARAQLLKSSGELASFREALITR